MSMYCSFVAFPPRKLAMVEADLELPGDLLRNEEENVPSHLAIGKTWDALHFAMTGLPKGGGKGPLANAITGKDGLSIGGDLSFGRAKLLKPKLVAIVAKALQAFPDENLRLRYKAGQFRDVEMHGGYGRDPEDEDDLVTLQSALTALRKFYVEAAERGDCVITAVL